MIGERSLQLAISAAVFDAHRSAVLEHHSVHESTGGQRQVGIVEHRADEALPGTHPLTVACGGVVVAGTDHLVGVEVVDELVPVLDGRVDEGCRQRMRGTHDGHRQWPVTAVELVGTELV